MKLKAEKSNIVIDFKDNKEWFYIFETKHDCKRKHNEMPVFIGLYLFFVERFVVMEDDDMVLTKIVTWCSMNGRNTNVNAW